MTEKTASPSLIRPPSPALNKATLLRQRTVEKSASPLQVKGYATSNVKASPRSTSISPQRPAVATKPISDHKPAAVVSKEPSTLYGRKGSPQKPGASSAQKATPNGTTLASAAEKIGHEKKSSVNAISLLNSTPKSLKPSRQQGPPVPVNHQRVSPLPTSSHNAPPPQNKTLQERVRDRQGRVNPSRNIRPDEPKEENRDKNTAVSSRGKLVETHRARYGRSIRASTVEKRTVPLKGLQDFKNSALSPPPPPPPPRLAKKKPAHQAAKKQRLEAPLGKQPSMDLQRAVSEESDPSIQRQGTGDSSSLSSVGSDIRRLRSILRRSRLNHASTTILYQEPLQSAFQVYDESSNDPMQRAGLRLLSAAVIPIQSAARRFLAFRLALSRMWAIVIVQSLARRWLTHRRLNREHIAASNIQAVCRGVIVRDRLLLEQCCAIEIQRHVRGLLATLDVYEQIYKITVAQSAVRRFLAVTEATDRMVSVIQIQSAARMFLCRLRLKTLTISTIKIQALWRCHSRRFKYQLELLDIIIVQSVCRRKIIVERYKRLLTQRQNKSATLIQKIWRGYDCSMNYLHFVADVLITQSTVRRWLACRLVHRLREQNAILLQSVARMCLAKLALKRIKAAVFIQRVWRGFVCYADYMFTIADVVIVQSRVRSILAKKEAARRRTLKRGKAVLTLQRFARRLRTKRLQAAITIQRYWRGFVSETEFFIMKYEHRAATLIQSYWRRFWCFSNFIIALDSVVTIQTARRAFVARKGLRSALGSALVIQCAIRSFFARRKTNFARLIHTIHDASLLASKQQLQSAIRIQCLARGYQARDAVGLYRKIRLIQAIWRGYCAHQTYKEYIAARRIQTAFRGYQTRTVYKEYTSARLIQASFRGYRSHKTYKEYGCARLIQAAFRGRQTYKTYRIYISARRIQAAIRGHQARLAVDIYLKVRQIQSMWRGYQTRVAVDLYLKVRLIQSAWRGYLTRAQVDLYLKARLIQSVWRGRKARIVFFRRRARKAARRNRAAVVIQRYYRGHFYRRSHPSFTMWLLKQTKKYGAAVTLQRVYRGQRAQLAFWHTLGSTIQIQAFVRGVTLRRHLKVTNAATRIQAIVRGTSVRYNLKIHGAATRIQSCERGSCVRRRLKIYRAATRLQNFFLLNSYRRRVKVNRAATRIQALARGFSVRREIGIRKVATQIQAFYRMVLLRRRFMLLAHSCVVIQTAYRGRLARKERRQRKFILELCRGTTPTSKKRHDLKDWEKIIAKQRAVDRAVRTIQRFFLMVKAEVDREVRLEMKRRKARRKHKKKGDDLDDILLENVWRKTIQHSLTEDSMIQRAEHAASKQLRTKGKSERRGSLDRQPSHDNYSHEATHYSERNERPLSSIQIRSKIDDDRLSDISTHYRVPPSRLVTLTRREIDEDFSLEEAWIDAEINNAKERRLYDKRSSKRSSSSRRKTSSPHPQKSLSHRRPPIYQEV